MSIKELSIKLPNRSGKLSGISDLLGREGVNIKAISVADAMEISTIRLVVDDPVKAHNILKSHGYEISESEVLAVETPDHPGGLNATLKPFKEADINVNYLYPSIGRVGDNAILIISVNKIEEARSVLKTNYIHLFDEELYST